MTNIPDWDRFKDPALRVLADGEIHRARDLSKAMADALGVSSAERTELTLSGQPLYQNRAYWALSSLFRSGVAERPVRGSYRITAHGRETLAKLPPEGERARSSRLPDNFDPSQAQLLDSAQSPPEQIEEGILRLHAAVAEDLLARLHDREPEFFEQAVLDLIMAKGYGGTNGAATRTQLVNDRGIDGIVDQDALGLSRIYVQAKRFAVQSSVGRPEVQAFVGALHGAQASQGVFITTGRLSQGAQDYADSVATRVVLIDGTRLTSLMIHYGVGVQTTRTVQIVEVDEDFFD